MDDVRAKAGATEYHGEIHFTFQERTDEHAVSRMPVIPGMLNPFGTVHAGAMLWLADVTASVLALGSTDLSADGKGFPLAINLNANLMGNLRDGEIRAEARFVRRGRRVMIVRQAGTGSDQAPTYRVVSPVSESSFEWLDTVPTPTPTATALPGSRPAIEPTHTSTPTS